MAWIKRNLIFVISIAIGVLLTGYCGWLFYGDLGQNSSVKEELEGLKTQISSLKSKPLFPSPENLAAAAADQQQVRQFLSDFHGIFPDPAPPEKMEVHAFQYFLQKYVADLKAAASNAGVQLRPDFNFAFSEQLVSVSLVSDDVPPWLDQMADIKTIAGILYDAKVNYIETIQRGAVSESDRNYEALGAKPVTNDTHILRPYKVVFRSFSREIASVLQGLAKSTNCFLVRDIDVRPSSIVIPPPGSTTATPAPVPVQPIYVPPRTIPGRPAPLEGRAPIDRSRRVMPQPLQPAQAQPDASPVPTGPVTVLSEKPLVVTLAVEIVKFKPVGK